MTVSTQWAHQSLGSRQLLVFRRIPDAKLSAVAKQTWKRREYASGSDADELNSFRRKVCCENI